MILLEVVVDVFLDFSLILNVVETLLPPFATLLGGLDLFQRIDPALPP